MQTSTAELLFYLHVHVHIMFVYNVKINDHDMNCQVIKKLTSHVISFFTFLNLRNVNMCNFNGVKLILRA